MPTLTAWFSSTALPTYYPTSSKLAVSAATLLFGAASAARPGFFDQGQPGDTDSLQVNALTNVTFGSVGTELDHVTSAAPGATRSGWLLDYDLSLSSISGDFEATWALSAAQGTAGLTQNAQLRVSVVVSSSLSSWTTKRVLTLTRVSGSAAGAATPLAAGQHGWDDAGANFVMPNAGSTTAVFKTHAFSGNPYAFTSGERLLFEVGFGNGNSATDRTLDLQYNTNALTRVGMTIYASPTGEPNLHKYFIIS